MLREPSEQAKLADLPGFDSMRCVCSPTNGSSGGAKDGVLRDRIIADSDDEAVALWKDRSTRPARCPTSWPTDSRWSARPTP